MFLTSEKSNHPGGRWRLIRLVSLLGGGALFQTTGGCQESVASFIDALGQPVATGIGNGLSNLIQALIVGVFI